MLEHGADVNKVIEYGGYKGQTPLALACQIGYGGKEIVKLLLEHGATIDQKVIEKAKNKPEILECFYEKLKKRLEYYQAQWAEKT